MSLEMDPSDGALGPGVATATVRPVTRGLAGSAAVLGRVRQGQLEVQAAGPPFGERALRPATGDEVQAIVDALDAGVPTIEVGTIATGDPAVATAPARLRAKGFSRHTFMCGQSGSGKTYTTGVLFERLLGATGLPLVVLDPNSDHVHLDAVADPDDTSPAAQRHRAVADGVRVARARGLPGDVHAVRRLRSVARRGPRPVAATRPDRRPRPVRRAAWAGGAPGCPGLDLGLRRRGGAGSGDGAAGHPHRQPRARPLDALAAGRRDVHRGARPARPNGASCSTSAACRRPRSARPWRSPSSRRGGRGGPNGSRC